MCHFVTAALRTAEDSDAFRELVARHRFEFSLLENRFVQRQLGPETSYLRASRGHCDCGTELGANRNTRGFEASLEKEVEKIRRKKNWGDARIQRWVEQKRAREGRVGRAAPGGSGTPDAASWLRFLTSALQLDSISELSLLLHWYSGSLDDEHIEIEERRTIHLRDLTADTLRDLEEDRLYTFTALAP